PPDAPVPVDDARLEKLGNGVDQPRAANGCRPRPTYGKDHGLVRGGIDAHLFDRAIARPHAEPDAPSFEGRAGRAGRAGQPILISYDDLAVRPYVHEKGNLA